MIADVPVGTFLSGGIDSSLVTALAQKVSGQPIKSYSIGFQNPQYNEAQFAAHIARYIGTDHHELYVTDNDFIQVMDDLPYFYDEPFADSSQIPTMLVSKLAKQDITVVLSGDGGDELFCGYNEYSIIALTQKFYCISDILRFMNKEGLLFNKVKSLAEIYDFQDALCQNITYKRKNQVSDLLSHDGGIPVWYRREKNILEKNWQVRRMLLDVKTYMAEDILTKVDRASMRYSLEARCPLLDYRVIEFAFSLPHQYVYANRIKKKLLKDVLYKYVPRRLIDRPKKGFAIPIGGYLRTSKRDLLKHIADRDFINEQDIFDYQSVLKLIQDFLSGNNREQALVWRYFVFQMWYEKYMV